MIKLICPDCKSDGIGFSDNGSFMCEDCNKEFELKESEWISD